MPVAPAVPPKAVPPVIRPKPVTILVTCRTRGGCNGTVTLRRGTTVVGKRTVKLRAGKTVSVSVKVLPLASIARVSRITVKAPQGLRASIVSS